MKLFLVVSAVVGLALSYEPIMQDYHEEYGIPNYNRIKAEEEAADFDGSRIVGGSQAAAGAVPHLVGLIITLTDNRRSTCGASMLSNLKSLTAAHCWRHGNNRGRTVTLVFGSATLMSGGRRVSTSNVAVHGSYNQGTLGNDIAMITHPRVAYTNQIQRIPLPSNANNNYSGQWARAAGFGRTSDGGGNTSSPRKHQVNLQVISNTVCRNTYSNVMASTLCTNGANRRGICQGDSGGPLALTNTRVLIGVSSFVHRNGCQRGFPSGFARVTSFLSWIRARL